MSAQSTAEISESPEYFENIWSITEYYVPGATSYFVDYLKLETRKPSLDSEVLMYLSITEIASHLSPASSSSGTGVLRYLVCT